MVRMHLPPGHNHTTKTFPREYPEGVGSVGNPSKLELLALFIAGFLSVVGVGAVVLRVFGLI